MARLTTDDEAQLRQLITMIKQTVASREQVLGRGAESVAILGNSLYGLHQLAAEMSARYGVTVEPKYTLVPLTLETAGELMGLVEQTVANEVEIFAGAPMAVGVLGVHLLRISQLADDIARQHGIVIPRLPQPLPLELRG